MTDSKRKLVTLVEESTFGETPNNPTMIQVPVTQGVTLADRTGSAQSRIIRSDRNVQDSSRLSLSGSGNIPMELVWGDAASGTSSTMEATYAIMRAAICSAAATAVANVASCTTTAGAKTITRASGDFAADGFEVGDVVRTSGSTGGADDGFQVVNTVAALTLTVTRPSNFTGSTSNVAVRRGARMKNGTTDRSFSAKVKHSDGTTNLHRLFKGQVCDGIEIAVADGQITTFNSRWTGKQSVSGTSEVLPGTPTFPALIARPVMDCVGVPTLYVGGSVLGVKSIRFSTSVEAAARTSVGTLGPQSVGRGSFLLTGSLEAYLSSLTELEKVRDNTASDILLVTRDSDGRSWSFWLSHIKYTAGDISDQTNDEMVTLSFQAVIDPTELCTFRFQVFDV